MHHFTNPDDRQKPMLDLCLFSAQDRCSWTEWRKIDHANSPVLINLREQGMEWLDLISL